MPYYEHQCQDPDCGHEWEDEYSIHDDPPKICPKCGKETAKRMISLGGKGIVELTGQELVSKLKDDAKKIAKEAKKDEKLYANLLGEGRYHNLQTQMDRRKRK